MAHVPEAQGERLLAGWLAGLLIVCPFDDAGLMGVCLFHSCKEVASLATADLSASGVAVVDAAKGTVPRHYFAQKGQ